jgi:catechol 2,3-dioxygenase-like lactoylglutathione lyase family enzyme
MQLAKQCVDVGLFTNRIDEMREFYAERIRLPYEEMLPVSAGVRQYRYGMLGSVLKINHVREALAPRVPGGYRHLTIADRRTPMPFQLADPDGNEIRLVPTGHYGIDQIGIHLGVTDEGEFDRFYREVLGCERLGERRYRLGQTIFTFERDPAARRAERTSATDAAGAVEAMRAQGIRYVTVQVRDCNAEYKRFMSMGAWEGAPPMTLGEVARICFIRDPDGNWIEISQRASLTGPLPKE